MKTNNYLILATIGCMSLSLGTPYVAYEQYGHKLIKMYGIWEISILAIVLTTILGMLLYGYYKANFDKELRTVLETHYKLYSIFFIFSCIITAINFFGIKDLESEHFLGSATLVGKGCIGLALNIIYNVLFLILAIKSFNKPLEFPESCNII